MATLTPDHLFEQADALLTLYPKRRPRQTEIRRAISAAYYGVFHFVLTQAADTYVGATRHSDPRYAIVYRSIQHGALLALCLDVRKSSLPDRLKPCAPAAGFGINIRIFASAVADLQDKRHGADYDPSLSFVRGDAQSAIDMARKAIDGFKTAALSERQAFLTLLLFAARGKK